MILHRLSMTVLSSALLCSASVRAQTTGTMGPIALQGTVNSAQEGAMEGVLVSAKRAGATTTTTVVTNAKGHYAFPAARLQAGHYAIAVRAVGYRLKGNQAADVADGAAASADIVLEKVTDLHQLADQLSNGDWLNSMPGNGFGCADCHTLQRIVNSTHTADEWMKVIPRMATYSNGSTPEYPQPIVPGPRQANEVPRNQGQLRRTAEYLASINLSKGADWSYPLKPLPRPQGRATHVIITSYDLPRPEAMPHDAIVTPDGRAWYSDFGHQFIGELDPESGKVTDYPFPTLKPNEPKGFLEIEADPDGNVWGAGMYQGLIAKVDGKTKKTTVYPIPEELQSNSTQDSMVSPQFSNIDGKVWTNNQDDHSILRLDVKTGQFENLGQPKTAGGQTIVGYGIPPDPHNNLYVLQFRGSEIGRIDAVTKELKIYKTPFAASRPRRGRVDAEGNLWFAEFGANAVAMFDPKTETIKEWLLPIKHSNPYDVVRNAKGEVWTGSEYTDRVTRLDPASGEFVDYLMPQEVNIRRVFFDDARNAFWIGANHSARLLKVEPLD
ncbi:MAG TPA: carboxypeptidase regulatory-like domain-containing protein [Xanthobacteraceae bacterium]